MHDSDFKDAISNFPSGVTIIMTADGDGRWWGFTASAFTSLSLEPPLVLVCLSKSASCHAVFAAAEEFSVNILRPHHERLAKTFATRGADKFALAGGSFQVGKDGVPTLRDALVTMMCQRYRAVDGGDHTILIGRVVSAYAGSGEPMVFCRRNFWHIAEPRLATSA
jgi:flavin reductase ActVB